MTGRHHGRETDDLQGSARHPESVVEVWVSEQMHARHPHSPLSLCEAFQVGPEVEATRRPELELEAET